MNIANQTRADRQPFLDYAKTSLTGGPEAFSAGPGAESLRGVLSKLSAQYGNPISSPAALAIASGGGLRSWQDDWRQAANIGLGGNYSNLASRAAEAGAGTTGSGYGDIAASVFAPKDSLTDLLRKLKEAGVTLNMGANIP